MPLKSISHVAKRWDVHVQRTRAPLGSYETVGWPGLMIRSLVPWTNAQCELSPMRIDIPQEGGAMSTAVGITTTAVVVLLVGLPVVSKEL